VADVRSEIAALEARQRGAEVKQREAKAALSSYRLSAMADESRELSRILAERRFSWTALLARLETTLPSDAGIQRLQPQFDKEGGITLTLQLVGRSREAVVPTLAALARDPAFGDVQLRSETQPEGNTADPFLFDIVSRYTPDAASGPTPESDKPEKADGKDRAEKKSRGPAGKKAGPAGKPGTSR
jgi:hypothetical protein